MLLRQNIRHTQRRKGLFWLRVLEVSFHDQQAPREKQYRARARQRKAGQLTELRKQRQKEPKENMSSSAHPSNLLSPVRLYFLIEYATGC